MQTQTKTKKKEALARRRPHAEDAQHAASMAQESPAFAYAMHWLHRCPLAGVAIRIGIFIAQPPRLQM